MSKEEIIVEHDKSLTIYDNLIPLDIRIRLFNLAKAAPYKIGWYDSEQPEYRPVDNPLHAELSISILKPSKFLDYVNTLTEKYTIQDKFFINLTLPCNVHFVHAHEDVKILLYYINLDWNEGFMGETLFYSEDKKRIQYASPYIPGRIIVFDGNIPHTIRPQSSLAPMHRFTLALKLKKPR